MIEPGTIFAPRGSEKKRGQRLVVVYSVDKHGSVYYEDLNSPNHSGGAVCHGHGSTAKFLEYWEPVAVMNFGGAWKRYQTEKYRRRQLEATLSRIGKKVDEVFDKLKGRG